MPELEFETPDWRGDVHKKEEEEPRGLMLNDELIESFHPLDDVIEGEVFVTGRMFLKGLQNLADKHGHNGPFEAEEVFNAINEVVQDEVEQACAGLVEKGLAEYDKDGNIRFIDGI